MTPQIEQVREKLEHLAPERLAEVEDFIDFLRERDQDRRLRRDYAQASEGAFARVWDNDEDAIYDKQSLADAVGMHVNQIKKYEAGSAQPTLTAMVKLAQVLHVSLDEMVFEEGERGPDEDLRLQFEAVSRMPPDEKKIIKALLEGMIVKHQTRQMVSNLSG